MEAKEEKRRTNDGVRIDVDLRVDGRSQTALMDIHHFFCSDVIIGDMSLLCHCRFY